MVDRLSRLREILREKRLRGFLTTNPSNLFYLGGLRAEGSFGIVTPGKATIFVPELLYQQAREIVKNFQVVGLRNRVLENIGKFLASEKIGRLGFEAGEVSVKRFKEMKRTFRRVKLVPFDGLLEKMRIVKMGEEIDSIRKSARLCVAAFRYVRDRIRVGMKEKIVACQLEYFMKKRGSEKPSFDIIVASGENTAYPHYRTGEREVRLGDCLLIDVGCVYKGYCSDLTRTLFLDIITRGQKPRFSLEFEGKFKKIYEAVRDAQKAAIDKIRPGVRCSTVDLTARRVIARAGFRDYFIHKTGHGVGLDVHELPWLEESSKEVLKPGMVITVEPGVYIPGLGGVRIEDMVLVTKAGYEILTQG